MSEQLPSTREKILDVAEALFARRGFSGVGMREVADRVEIGKSTLFHHFRSKLQLYCQVLDRVLSRIAVAVQPSLNSDAPAAEKLTLWLDALTDALADHPTTARILLRGLFEDDDLPDAGDPDADAVGRSVESLIGGFQDLVRLGIREGAFRPLSVPDATKTVIGATVYHFASGEVGEAVTGAPVFSAESVRRRRREVIDFVRNAMAAPAARTEI
ncbi:MAG: TetR/AcrR family transcriptional regulator [Myxococcota bacterium]